MGDGVSGLITVKLGVKKIVTVVNVYEEHAPPYREIENASTLSNAFKLVFRPPAVLHRPLGVANILKAYLRARKKHTISKKIKTIAYVLILE